MKKLLTFLLLASSLAVAQLPFPQSQPYALIRRVTCNATACSSPNEATTGFWAAIGVGYYKVSWTIRGTISSCTLSLDSRPDVTANWTTGGIASTGTVGSCATQGSYFNSSAKFVNIARITPTIAGTGEITFTVLGGLFPFTS